MEVSWLGSWNPSCYFAGKWAIGAAFQGSAETRGRLPQHLSGELLWYYVFGNICFLSPNLVSSVRTVWEKTLVPVVNSVRVTLTKSQWASDSWPAKQHHPTFLRMPMVLRMTLCFNKSIGSWRHHVFKILYMLLLLRVFRQNWDYHIASF